MTRRHSMLTRLGLISSLAMSLLAASNAGAVAQTCTPDQIAAVIDSTGAELRKLNAMHQPAFQAKLRRVAERNGWPEADIETKGAELLNDSETARLDDQATDLLAELDNIGDEAASDEAACTARLAQIKTTSSQLLEVTAAKAAHVSAKLDAGLRDAATANPAKSEPPKSEPKVASRPPPLSVETKPALPPLVETKPAPLPPIETKQSPPPSKQAATEPWRTVPATPPASAPKVGAWETDTQHRKDVSPPPGPGPVADLSQQIPTSPDHEFTAEDIRAAGSGLFSNASAGLASVIEYAFRTYGHPNGYIIGKEGGGALLAGLRYGDGTLVTKIAGERKVYWQGPSVGFDFGVAGSRVLFLVYNLKQPDEMFARFAGVEGSAYVVGGVGITFLKKGRLLVAPIRTGLGLRVGANVGYLKFTPKASLNPF